VSTAITAAAFTDTVERMMEDPEMTGQTLAFGIALIHEMRMQHAQGKSRSRKSENAFTLPNTWRDAAWLLYPSADEGEVWRLLKRIIGDDAPRYEMPRESSDARLCMGTMLRPLGAPCRRRTTWSAGLVNPFNGERRHAGACSNPTHRAIFESALRAANEAWKVNGKPEPKNNTGGHLMRYFTYPKWDELYGWASYRFKPGTTPEPEPPRARLALVTSIGSARVK
jgi:hypothetical protein